jgi:hypothetical protein
MLKEAIKAVETINEEILEILEYEDDLYNFYGLCICSDGNMTYIKFCGVSIWSSENDERKYIDEEECIYEPLETYLRREIKKVLNVGKNLLEKL